MSTRLIGFIGIDKYDLIHHLSRILVHLDKKVVLIDLSETGALTSSVPIPEEFDCSVVDYNGVDFTKSIEDELLKNYEYVLIDFGFQIEHRLITKCYIQILVTDLQKFNAEKLGKLKEISNDAILVVRDSEKYKISMKRILRFIPYLSYRPNYIYEIDYDEYDYVQRLNTLYNYRFRFCKCSKSYKSMLYGICTMIVEDSNKVRRAFKRAEKGRKA